MATTMQTHARMAIGYGDLMTDGSVSTLVLGNCAAATGYSVNNLKYEDPSHVLLTASHNTSNPTLTITFSSTLPTSDILIGFCNQDFLHKYDSLKVEANTTDTWPGTTMGTLDLKGGLAALTMETDFDFLVLPQGATTNRFWRITWELASGTRPAFTVGNIFFMRRYHFTKNPTRDLFPHTLTVPIEEERGLGGTLHVTRGPVRTYQAAEYTWTRIADTEMAKLTDIASSYAGRLVGIIQPGQSNRVLPIGLAGHLFGRIASMRVQPSPGTTDTTHLNNVTMRVNAGW